MNFSRGKYLGRVARSQLDEGSRIKVLSEVAVALGANNAQLRLIYRELGIPSKVSRPLVIFAAPIFRIRSLFFHPSDRNTISLEISKAFATFAFR